MHMSVASTSLAQTCGNPGTFSDHRLNQFYYVFGFLGLVFVILLITCSEISIVLCYFQLCSEDYNWWWRAFLTSGSSGVYLFIYGIFYFSSKLDISGFTSTLLYFGYMFMARPNPLALCGAHS